MEKTTQNKLHGLVLELLRVGITPVEIAEMLSFECNRLKDSFEYIKAIDESNRM